VVASTLSLVFFAAAVGLGIALVVLSPSRFPVDSPILLASGLFGLWMVFSLGGFLLKSLVSGGVWSVARDWVEGSEIRPFGDFLDSLGDAFSTAFLQYALQAITNLFLMATLVVTALSAYVVGFEAGNATGSEIIAPALVWAAALTLFASFAVLVRLSVEMMPGPLFLEGASFGEAMLRAARIVTGAVIEVYRVFIQAAVVLLIALLIQFAAIMIQNIALEVPGMAGIGAGIRFLGDLTAMLGTALFILVMQISFIGLYGIRRGVIEDLQGADEPLFSFSWASSRPAPPSLGDLMPESTPHIFELDSVTMASSDEEDLAQIREEE